MDDSCISHINESIQFVLFNYIEALPLLNISTYIKTVVILIPYSVVIRFLVRPCYGYDFVCVLLLWS